MSRIAVNALGLSVLLLVVLAAASWTQEAFSYELPEEADGVLTLDGSNPGIMDLKAKAKKTNSPTARPTSKPTPNPASPPKVPTPLPTDIGCRPNSKLNKKKCHKLTITCPILKYVGKSCSKLAADGGCQPMDSRGHYCGWTCEKNCVKAKFTDTCIWNGTACFATPVTDSPTTGAPFTPSLSPVTLTPTAFPTTNTPTISPVKSPTHSPTTTSPTEFPTTPNPGATPSPTAFPTTKTPSTSPTTSPTTVSPTKFPSKSPTTSPTPPTKSPTSSPTTSHCNPLYINDCNADPNCIWYPVKNGTAGCRDRWVWNFDCTQFTTRDLCTAPGHAQTYCVWNRTADACEH